MANIFNIQSDYAAIMAELDALEGEITPELEEALAINEEDRDAKMEAYAYIIKEAEANTSLIKDEIDRLRTLTKLNENKAKRLKTTIIKAMELFELYGKSGNLAHRLPYHNLFTRNTKAVVKRVDKIEHTIDIVEDEQELFKFTITSELPYTLLTEFIYMANDMGIDIETATNIKAKEFKNRVIELHDIQHDIDVTGDESIMSGDVVRQKLAQLEELAEVVDNVSLTIR